MITGKRVLEHLDGKGRIFGKGKEQEEQDIVKCHFHKKLVTFRAEMVCQHMQ